MTLEVKGYQGVTFEPTYDALVPASHTLPFHVIETLNSQSSVFESGTLYFREQERDEIFKALGRHNWQERYWDDASITKLLTKPTVEEVNRFLKIKDYQTVERIRGRMMELKYAGQFTVYSRIEELINKLSVATQGGEKMRVTSVTAEYLGMGEEVREANSLREVNDALNAQMEDLRQQIEKLKEKKEVVKETSALVGKKSTPSSQKKTTTTKVKKST